MRRAVKVKSLLIALAGLSLSVPPSAPGAIKTFSQYMDETGLKSQASSWDFTVFSWDADFSAQALARLDKALQKIVNDLVLKRKPVRKCLVFIWKDRGDYLAWLRKNGPPNLSDSGGFCISSSEQDPPQLFLYDSDSLFTSVIPHELAHVMLETALNLSRRYEIPIWLHEGFAQCQEDRPFEPVAQAVLEARRRGSLIPLKEVTGYRRYPQTPERKLLFYQESEALVRFLLDNQRTPGEFFDLCHALIFWADDLEATIKNKYGKRFPTINALEEKWIWYLLNAAGEQRP